LTVYRLTNTVQPYAWGSTSVIADLLGVPDDGRPKAELWIGAHPTAPSRLPDGRPLGQAIEADAARLVGTGVAAEFGPRLPYLLKVLSAAAPLSLQVHPNAEQAAAGFADEEERGVTADAPDRRYRDPFHKPEMVLALERFEALCGLRDAAQTSALLDTLEVDHPAWPRLHSLLSGPDAVGALRDTVGWLLGGDERLPSLVDAVARAAAVAPVSPELTTAVALAEQYPGDSGVLVALLLNRVTLAPGEAMFLPAGNLHAYLKGTAIEVMAASDNVLRAGLTSKHVDAAEVLRIGDFTPQALPMVEPERHGAVTVYRPGAAEFELGYVELGAADAENWHELPMTGPRSLLVLRGAVEVATGTGSAAGGGAAEQVGRGTSLFVPAAAGTLRLRGQGAVVVAAVPGPARSRDA
jgi:mannose-6-phosphate isomerase